APLLPDIAKSFSGLLLAIIPLLPELVKLGTNLLPPLIGLMVEMAPVMLKVIDAFTWLVENVIVPLVIPALQQLSDNFTTAINTATSVVRGAKDFLGRALEGIGNFFGDLGDSVRIAWEGIVRVIAVSVKKVGELLQDVPSIHIPGTDINIGEGVSNLGDKFVNWAEAHGAATGGFIRGPGSATSDSIPVMLSNGEYVVNAASTARALPLLEAINAGWVPPASLLHAMVPGFAEGGLVPGKKFAQSMDPADYLMGGFSRSAIDCSAMVSATVNDALGLDPFDSRMSTVNQGDWLSAKGAQPGLGGPGDIAIAWYDRGGGANGHTAMRLGDGTGVESRSGDGVVIGNGATKVTNSMFDQHMHIPKELLLGGDPGAGVTGKGLGPSMKGGGKVGSGTSGGGMKKSRQSAGGGSTSGSTSGGAAGESESDSGLGGM
ncbi:hypothetical protein, partial [Streptomyces sp. NPDC055990]|uniref:hypothetical protein n=1 Tax=Streptomyces sp. NPDC055990 TaxID=3345672 RepID=UPI0035DE6C8E